MERPDNNNIEYKLSQLLDGDLSPDEEAVLLSRLRDDEELSRTWAGYRRLDEMLGDLAVAPELSSVDYESQRADIMAVLAKRALLNKPQRRVLPWVFGGALAAAAAAVLAIGAVMFFRTTTPGPADGPTSGYGSVASAIVLPSQGGTVESAVAAPARLAGESVAIVQIRVNVLDDDEFMLSSPADNPLAHGADIGKGTQKPLPAGTVLMMHDRPIERDAFDWFDVY